MGEEEEEEGRLLISTTFSLRQPPPLVGFYVILLLALDSTEEGREAMNNTHKYGRRRRSIGKGCDCDRQNVVL